MPLITIRYAKTISPPQSQTESTISRKKLKFMQRIDPPFKIGSHNHSTRSTTNPEDFHHMWPPLKTIGGPLFAVNRRKWSVSGRRYEIVDRATTRGFPTGQEGHICIQMRTTRRILPQTTTLFGDNAIRGAKRGRRCKYWISRLWWWKRARFAIFMELYES